MAIAPNSDHADVPVMVGRRSTRLSVAVPITISGKDSAGNEFRENTFTLNVNKHGAEIATNRLLAANSEITVENATLGRKVQAKVVQRREKRTPNSPYEVSLELLDPENIWGVRFPPADWANGFAQKPAGSPDQAKPAPAVQEADASRESVAQPAPAPANPNGAKTALAVPAETVEPGQENAKEAAAEETAIELESPLIVPKAEAVAEPSSAQVEQPVAATVPPDEPPAPPEPAAAQESAQGAQSVGTRLKDLLGRLEEASARLEDQLSKVNEARAGLKSETERAQADIRQAGEQAAGSAVIDFRSKLSSEWEAAAGPLFEETKRRLENDVSAAVAAFGKEAGAHLARLTQESGPELESKQKQAVSLAKEQIARAAEAAVSEFNSKLSKSAEEASSALRSGMNVAAEKSLTVEANRLAQSLNEQAEGLLRGDANPIPRLRERMQAEVAEAGLKFKEACVQESDKARAGVREDLMKSVSAITSAAEEANAGLWESSKAIKHDLTFKGEKIRNHLAEIASASEEGFKNYTQVQVRGAQEEVREGLRVIAGRTAQEFSGELQKAIEGQLENLGPQLQKQTETAVRLGRESLESASRESLAETQTKLAGLSREALDRFSADILPLSEKFNSELRTLTAQFRDQLRFTLEEFRATVTQEMRSGLREVAAEEERAASGRIQAEGRAARERVITEIKDSAAKAAEEGERAIAETKERTEAAARQASDTVYKQIGIATVTLKDWGDQAAARLEAQFQKSISTFEKQVQELTSRSLEASRQRAEAATEETLKRLEQATRILRGESKEPS
ncbi:MAG: hypothetical protein ACM3NO_07650 [Deltaproteobacteria bacterium]